MNNSLIGKMIRFMKLKSSMYGNLKMMVKKVFMVFHAHIINIHSAVHKSLFFRNEEKLVAILVYYSLRRVATSGFRNISPATSS